MIRKILEDIDKYYIVDDYIDKAIKLRIPLYQHTLNLFTIYIDTFDDGSVEEIATNILLHDVIKKYNLVLHNSDIRRISRFVRIYIRARIRELYNQSNTVDDTLIDDLLDLSNIS